MEDGDGWYRGIAPEPDFREFLYSIPEPEHRSGIRERIINVFRSYGITSFDKLLAMTDAELLQLDNFGRKGLWAIDAALEQRNLYRVNRGRRRCPTCGQIIR
jgi:DNA-directed RNA polymerase alpha subunit